MQNKYIQKDEIKIQKNINAEQIYTRRKNKNTKENKHREYI